MNLSFYVWCSQQKGRTLHFDEDVLKEKPQNQYKAHSGGENKERIILFLTRSNQVAQCFTRLAKQLLGWVVNVIKKTVLLTVIRHISVWLMYHLWCLRCSGNSHWGLIENRASSTVSCLSNNLRGCFIMLSQRAAEILNLKFFLALMNSESTL